MKMFCLTVILVLCIILQVNAQKRNDRIKIIKDYHNVSTIKSLLASFKGKPVLVDMWASWCQPCKEEFKYSHTLYLELKKRNVGLLYISIDKDTTDVAWRKDIEMFDLSGSHIKANKMLRDELTTIIWGGIDVFSIPNYVLFDKNGNVLIKSAMMPETGANLIKQVESVLAKK